MAGQPPSIQEWSSKRLMLIDKHSLVISNNKGKKKKHRCYRCDLPAVGYCVCCVDRVEKGEDCWTCEECYRRHENIVEDRREVYRTGFRAFDKDGDGSITVEELKSVMEELGTKVTLEQLETLMEEVDLDKNGTIEWHEFLPMLAKMLGKMITSMSDIRWKQTIDMDQMQDVKDKLMVRPINAADNSFDHVVLLVVVKEEIQPVLDKYNPTRNPEVEKQLLNLAYVYECDVVNSAGRMKLSVLQVANSPHYHRHFSGFTQSSAIVSIASAVLHPDLLLSFGTAGGIEGRVHVGDAVLGSGTVFIDRTRTSSKVSHDWGVFGGPTMPAPRLAKDLNMRSGHLGCQISYNCSQLHMHLIRHLDVVALDMESASEAQISMQVGLNFMAIKVISNLVYLGDGAKMEEEYVQNKLEVSKRSLALLDKLLNYLVGKCPQDLQ
eukprot:CAMPEP_0119122668 /NCGR_PEP_ID=MMETSP1310-20130426/2856_1 /TAXON_ID=464262 /ORGANISM="Genus nov. species nov., Strain RCC2339" /LENGTH=435 /DNA_ID=CAMNT_0007112357 /DNA_START=30 /DNA_END=1337 /DNA_ORIENTATION=-